MPRGMNEGRWGLEGSNGGTNRGHGERALVGVDYRQVGVMTQETQKKIRDDNGKEPYIAPAEPFWSFHCPTKFT